MVLLLLTASAAIAVAAPPADRAAGKPQTSLTRVISPTPGVCSGKGMLAADPKGRANMRRLGELPPAQAYMAVYRTDEKGCLDPMLASERQGGARRR